MVLPVIPIALMAAARFIAKKGITAAIKKFGKKTVTEAKKHVKDVTTAVRPGVKQTKDGVRGMQNARQLGRQAATVGAVGGAAVTAAALKARLAKKDREIKEAQGAAAKAKLRADKEIINAALAKAMLEDKKSSAPPKSIKPKSRPTKKPTLRPRARPTNLNMGGMAKTKSRTENTDYRMGGMFMKNGKK